MAVGSILLSFVLAIVIGISGVLAPGGGTALGASTTLTILSGDVQVSRDGGPFAAGTDGAVLGPGDVIRTAAGARAVLTYFEGSTVSIEPSSELAIQETSTSPDGGTVVVMTQNLGRTWHVVTKLITGGSRYEVRTPAATASVRGTAFEVGVVRDATGESQTAIITTEGAVAAAAPATPGDPAPEPVLVPAGFQTSAKASERKPAPPALAPEPERSVSVTVGSANSLVVDPLGRANGMKDGKLVIQTPGATVTMLAGTLQITLPNVPDGTLATHVSRTAGKPDFEVPVITTVQEKGKPTTLARDAVGPGATVSGLEVKKSSGDAAPTLRRVESEDEKKELKTPKARVEGPAVPGPATVFRPGLGGDPQVLARIVEERRGGAQRTAERGRNERDGEGEKEQGSGADGAAKGGFVPTLPFQAAPAADRQLEERKADAEKETKAAEQMQKAASEAQRVVTQTQADINRQQRQAAEQQARAAAQAQQAEQRRLELERQQKSAEQERLLKQAQEREREAKAAQEKAARELKEKEQKAKELEETQRRLKELEEKLKREREQQQQGPGSEKDRAPESKGGGNNKK